MPLLSRSVVLHSCALVHQDADSQSDVVVVPVMLPARIHAVCGIRPRVSVGIQHCTFVIGFLSLALVGHAAADVVVVYDTGVQCRKERDMKAGCTCLVSPCIGTFVL